MTFSPDKMIEEKMQHLYDRAKAKKYEGKLSEAYRSGVNDFYRLFKNHSIKIETSSIPALSVPGLVIKEHELEDIKNNLTRF